MTAVIVPLRRARGRQGRQSAAIELTRDLRDEVTALADDGRDFASLVLRLSRLAQTRHAAQLGLAELLDELERIALRHSAQMTAAGVHARADRACLDGEARGAGHGRAA